MLKIINEEFAKLIEKRKWVELKKRLVVVPEPEITDILFLADKHNRVLIFRAISRKKAAATFSCLEPEQQDALLKDLTDVETQHLLATLSPDDRTALLEELPAGMTRRLFGLLSTEDLREARELLGYPEESVGRVMTPDYVSVNPNWTVAKSLEYIRKNGKDSETINMVYVIDKSGKLLDDIRLRRLILASPNDTIEALMDSSFAALSAFDDRELAVMLMQRYDLVALPVVDSDKELIGIVTFDDVMDIAEEEATEDIQKAASVTPLKMGYHRVSITNLYKKRTGWLVILVLLNIFSAMVITAFEGNLSGQVAIVLLSFIPILMGSGGNAGAQASTLIIRALTTGDIKLSQWFEIMHKELKVGLMLGVTLGVVGGLLGFMLGHFDWRISFIISISMLAIVMVGNLVGMILPFIFIRIRIDPAVASGPLITTIADASGLFIYFSIAAMVLGW